MKTLIKILFLSVLWFSCESSTEPQNNDIHGCLDSQACNYNPNANIDNNSCIYEEDGCNVDYGSFYCVWYYPQTEPTIDDCTAPSLWYQNEGCDAIFDGYPSGCETHFNGNQISTSCAEFYLFCYSCLNDSSLDCID